MGNDYLGTQPIAGGSRAGGSTATKQAPTEAEFLQAVEDIKNATIPCMSDVSYGNIWIGQDISGISMLGAHK